MKLFNHIIHIILFTGGILFPVNAFSQLKQYRLEQLEDMGKNRPKNIVVFIHTDWCNYCKAMQNSTFKNKEIVQMLNEHFYFVNLNAEDENDIVFQGKKYRLKKTGKDTGIHEIVSLFSNSGAMAYPALIILNPEYTILFKEESFLKTKELKGILEKYVN